MREREQQPEVLSEQEARQVIEDFKADIRTNRNIGRKMIEEDLQTYLDDAKRVLASLEVDDWAKPNGKQALNSAVKKAEAILGAQSSTLAEKRAIVPELERAFAGVMDFKMAT